MTIGNIERYINDKAFEMGWRPVDEARNLEKAEELQRSGVQVVYGVKGLKVKTYCNEYKEKSGYE